MGGENTCYTCRPDSGANVDNSYYAVNEDLDRFTNDMFQKGRPFSMIKKMKRFSKNQSKHINNNSGCGSCSERNEAGDSSASIGASLYAEHGEYFLAYLQLFPISIEDKSSSTTNKRIRKKGANKFTNIIVSMTWLAFDV